MNGSGDGAYLAYGAHGPAESDRQLVAAIIDGDPQAFPRLMKLHQQTCARILARMVPQDLVADLLQETFLAVYRQLQRFRFDASLRTWISRVAYTTGLQYLRRRKLEAQWFIALEEDALPEVDGDAVDPAGFSQSLQASQWLLEAMARLSPAQRLIVGLHYGEDFDIGQIVQVTGLPAGTIKSHLYRARQLMKNDLLRRAPVGELL